jgi:serine/threonine-protein kinase
MLLVSQATAKVAVPDLTGRPFEEAAAMAADAGLVVTRNDVPGPGVAGTVVSQSPAVQTRLGRGDPVALTVTQGVPQVEVPPVVGRSTDEAVQILQQAGLGYEASYVPSTEVEPMTVVKTTPEAGARVDHGTAVNLDIALAPAQPAENTSPQSDRGPGRGRGREDRDDD